MIRFDALSLGASPPDDVNVLVTVPAGGAPAAMRLDDRTGALTVSQLFHSAVRAPGNIGFIPQTVGEGGDPLQALLVMGHTLAPGTVTAARPIGVIAVTGDAGHEVTLVAVPAARLTLRYDAVRNYHDLPQAELRQIAHYFCHYREVDEAAPRTPGWGDLSEARRVVLEAAERVRRPLPAFD